MAHLNSRIKIPAPRPAAVPWLVSFLDQERRLLGVVEVEAFNRIGAYLRCAAGAPKHFHWEAETKEVSDQ